MGRIEKENQNDGKEHASDTVGITDDISYAEQRRKT